MRIAIVGSDRYQQTVANIITKSNLTCQENLIPLLDVELAEAFINNKLIAEGKHIDLIIADDEINNNRNQKNLCDWLRSNRKESYSNRNFRISSIPILLLKQDEVNETFEADHDYRYNAILSLKNNGFDERIKYCSQKIVKDWRQNIPNDLDILNIDLNGLDKFTVGFDYNKFSKNSSYYLTRTKVLSNDFIKSPKPLDYQWLSNKSLIKIEESIDQYDKIIKALNYKGKKAFERNVLHAFYNKFKHFLLRDTYEKLIYDKRFVISSTSHYHIPDFILTSPFPEFIKTSISEIKRHNIFFEYLPSRHKNFTEYFQNALNQSSNYEDDFNDLNHKGYLKDKIGYQCEKFQVDLIIGLDERINDFIMNKIKKHYSTVNLITHNSLRRKTEAFYYRSRATSIF